MHDERSIIPANATVTESDRRHLLKGARLPMFGFHLTKELLAPSVILG